MVKLQLDGYGVPLLPALNVPTPLMLAAIFSRYVPAVVLAVNVPVMTNPTNPEAKPL